MLTLLLALTVGQPDAAATDPRLDQALKLVRPHLVWQAPFAPPSREGRARVLRQEIQRQTESDTPWQAALGGPQAWEGDIPRALVEQTERLARAHPERPAIPPLSAYPWRVKDTSHADIGKALVLLDALADGPEGAKARRWAAELRRNNTVLTLDVAGAFPAGKKARFVLDARNTNSVRVSLFRLDSAEDLLRVTDRIGTDFIFLSHEFENIRERIKLAQRELMKEELTKEEPLRLPEALQKKPIASWEQPLTKLRQIDRETLCNPDALQAFDEDEEANRYDDRCHRHRRRLEREYLPQEHEFSSWRGGLILEVPGEHLAKPGAYLLRVEANGQFALAPLLVDPPALTLRRCPDGVLAVVSSPGGKEPLARATVQARKQHAAATTDAGGVTFLSAHARGDRAIVAEHQGRFAVGGFGAVFAGVYHTPENDRRWRHGRDRMQRALPERHEGLVYADGLVLALWTDRPLYQPGEDVQGKLIVRKRGEKSGDTSFRGDEYGRSHLDLLPEGTPVAWRLLDYDGNEKGKGQGKLNDFGTLATTFHLPAEAQSGACRLVVTVNDRQHHLPDVFRIDTFRRLPAEITLTGLPEKLSPGGTLNLTLTGRQGGLPVRGGKVMLALCNDTTRWNLTPDELTLDPTGKVRANITLPVHLPAETMTLQATLAEGQTITKRAFRVTIDSHSTPLLGRLPRFVSADQPVSWPSKATEIELEQGRHVKGTPTFKLTRVPVVAGQARFRFPAPGWYSVRAGREVQEVFAHGGMEPPDTTFTRRQIEREEEFGPWVDLAHYAGPEGDNPEQEDNRPPLLAFFGSQEGEVDHTLPVLVYVPFDSARLLLTLEGHSVIDYHTASVTGKESHYHIIALPLRERHRPHFYLQGTILGGNEMERRREGRLRREQKALERLEDDPGEDPAWCRVIVNGPARRGDVRVSITADRPEYAPGEKVTVEVRTLDALGKPVRTELALSVVEEQLYAVAGDRLPAVLATFTGTRGAEFYRPKTWRHSPGVPSELLLRQKQLRALEAIKSEQAQLERLIDEDLDRRRPWIPREEFGDLPVAVIPLAPPRVPGSATAFAVPILRTDAEGKARVTFPAPTGMTRYRIGALALTRTGTAGIGTSTLRAGKPVEVEIFLPAEVPLGVPTEVPIQVRNHTDRDRTVQVMPRLEGLKLLEGTPRTTPLKVPAKGLSTMRLTVIPQKKGTVTLTVQVGDETNDDAETRRTEAIKPKEVPTPEAIPEPKM